MKIAVPKFGSRVSPRFDCAQAFLVVTIDDAEGMQRQEYGAADWGPLERIHQLVELEVQTVICGGIDAWSAESLRLAGITVYSSITGDVDEALRAWMHGEMGAGERTHAPAVRDPSPAGEADGPTAGALNQTQPRQ